MSLLLRSLVLIIFGMHLSACSYLKNVNTFRNRSFDYTKQAVINLPQPATPPGLPTPSFAPELIIPPGQDFYPANPYVLLTPPDFYETYPIPTLPAKTKTKK